MTHKIVITPDNPRIAEGKLTGIGLFDIFIILIRHMSLIYTLFQRDIQARYKGSALGLTWMVLLPLTTLIVYTFVFGVVFKSRFILGNHPETLYTSSLVMYSGLVLYGILSETITRSPSLIQEHAPYVKRVVFPLRTLAMVSVLTACYGAGIAFLLMISFYIILIGIPPITLLWLPVVILPIIFIALGLSWALSSLGAYIKDIRHVSGLASWMLMLSTPILYPPTLIPEKYQWINLVNPITAPLTEFRRILFESQPPNFDSVLLSYGISLGLAWIGYTIFTKTQKGFADVL